MIEVETTVELNKNTLKKLNKLPSEILYSVARQTLDLSYQTIPLSDRVNRGRLRSSSMAYGVKKHTNNDFSIGSETDYASYVWVMNNETTNWTTPGTQSAWYDRVYKEKGKSILQNAINETK